MEKIKKAIIVLISMAMCIVGLTSCKGEKIPQNYIDAITEYKSNLKDPASLRIYGNVLVANLKDSENYIISMVCDAKNSYGGYGGINNKDCSRTLAHFQYLAESSAFNFSYFPGKFPNSSFGEINLYFELSLNHISHVERKPIFPLPYALSLNSLFPSGIT